MRIDHQLLPKLAKTPRFSATLTLAVLSEGDHKKGRWLTYLPEGIRARVKQAEARLHSPLKAGARLWVQGTLKGEEDFWIALLPENSEPFFLLEFARDSVKACVEPATT